ncbi:hypothetical protein GCM10023187_54130 [Nibrella viscosa]|uniref:Uncharacterized protein n=1 Tax=Nibrella viscosa TaxID=1084524 RepID=A0ABP8L082_9BACT
MFTAIRHRLIKPFCAETLVYVVNTPVAVLQQRVNALPTERCGFMGSVRFTLEPLSAPFGRGRIAGRSGACLHDTSRLAVTIQPSPALGLLFLTALCLGLHLLVTAVTTAGDLLHPLVRSLLLLGVVLPFLWAMAIGTVYGLRTNIEEHLNLMPVTIPGVVRYASTSALSSSVSL